MAPRDPYPPVPIPTVPGGPTVPMPPVDPGLGPRPAAPVFPFAEARAALQALDELLEDLRVLAGRNRALTSGLVSSGTFHGSARGRFEARVDEATDQLAPITTEQLHLDREWLVQAIAAAHLRHDEYVDDLRTWEYRRDHPTPPVPA